MEETRTYFLQCANAQQATTLKLPVWFGSAAHGNARDGSRPNELLVELTETQAWGLGRDHGITATPAVAKL